MRDIATLEQTAILKGRQRLSLRDDGTLLVSNERSGRLQELTMEVGRLEQNPRREKLRATPMLVGAFIFLLPIALLLWAAAVARPRSGDRPACLIGGAVFLIPVGLCIREYIRRSYDVLVFLAPQGGDNLVLHNERPSPELCRAFVEKLQQEIAKHRVSALGGQGMAEQLRQLAKLREEGILTDAEFARAKERVIETGKPAGTIGFGP